MSRIQKLEMYYQEQLKEKNIKDVSVFIQSIVDADITKGKYARFLINSFLNEKFLEEDLVGGLDSTVGQAIRLFDKHKGKLPLEQRSVYALDKETDEMLYQSPGDLWNVVKQYQGELSGKELKKEEQEKIYRETEFIYKDEETGFQIISPLTEESAKWWGKGTRWCTSADNNNMFEYYAEDAPLFILLMPASASTAGNGDKLQVWKDDYRIQFMDEADKTVSLDYIEKHWNILEPICMWLNSFRFVPTIHINEDMYTTFIKKDAFSIQWISEHIITQEMCELAIQQNGMALQFIPDKYITKELCELAVKQNEMSLEYVPEKYKNYELCKIAIQHNGLSLRHLPEEFITEELYKIAIKQNGYSLRYVPSEYKTIEMCKTAIQQDGTALAFIPDEYITKELCELAVKNNGLALEYVPGELRTKETYKIAIQQNGLALQFVPEEYKTKELCELALKQNEDALLFIPIKLRTKEIFEPVTKYDIYKYQETYQELKEYFPTNSLSLDIN